MAPARTTTLAHEVGRRIQALRAERGISLSELARGANLGKATLSAVESGTRNATLETLYAIAARLDVPLAALLAPPTPSAPPTVRGTAVTAELLEAFTDDRRRPRELYRLTIHPGPTQTSPAHPQGVTEYLTVFAGTALVGPPRRAHHISRKAATPPSPPTYRTSTPALDTEVRASLSHPPPGAQSELGPHQAPFACRGCAAARRFGFRVPALPPVASACRAAVWKAKTGVAGRVFILKRRAVAHPAG